MARPLGVLVAGGRGRRLGLAVSKSSVSLAGETLLERALARLVPLCDEVVLALSDAGAAPAPLPERVIVALDPPGRRGPLAGLVAGLSARAYSAALVLAVDFPLAHSGALAALAGRLGNHHAVVPEPAGRAQPLFAAYAAGALAPLRDALERGEQALVAAVMALDPLVLRDPELRALEGGLDNFLNVNRPEDLAEARRRLGLPEEGAA